jgi:hypothetical protein
MPAGTSAFYAEILPASMIILFSAGKTRIVVVTAALMSQAINQTVNTGDIFCPVTLHLKEG